MVESDCVTVLVEEAHTLELEEKTSAVENSGPRALLQLQADFDVVGHLAAVTGKLAERTIPVVAFSS